MSKREYQKYCNLVGKKKLILIHKCHNNVCIESACLIMGLGRFRENFLENQVPVLRLEEVSQCNQAVVIVKNVPESVFMSDQKCTLCEGGMCGE